MDHGLPKRPLLWSCVASALFASTPSYGELGLGVGYIGEYSSNMLRSQLNPQEGWTNVWLAGLAYRENGPNLAANGSVQVERRDYSQDMFQNASVDNSGTISYSDVVYTDETLAYASMGALWTISPQRLTWTLTDRLNQLPRDAANPLSPGNRDAVNTLDTGPDLLIPFSAVDTLVVGARAGNTWFKYSQADSNHAALHVRFRHRVDALSEVSLNAEQQKTHYIKPQGVDGYKDFSRLDSYARYDQRYPQSRIVLDLGGTRIMPLGAGDDTSGWLGRLNLAQRLSPTSSVGTSLARELSSVSTALLAGVADPTLGGPIADNPVSATQGAIADLYVSRRADVYYNQTSTILGIQAAIFQRRYDYLDIPMQDRTMQDRHEIGARLQLSYQLTPTTSAGVYAGTTRTVSYFDVTYGVSTPPEPAEPKRAERLDRDVVYGASWSYRLNPNLTLSLEASNTERNSSYPPAPLSSIPVGVSVFPGSYTETRGMIRLIFNTNPSLTATGR